MHGHDNDASPSDKDLEGSGQMFGVACELVLYRVPDRSSSRC